MRAALNAGQTRTLDVTIPGTTPKGTVTKLYMFSVTTRSGRCLEANANYAEPQDASCPYADWNFTASYCPAATP